MKLRSHHLPEPVFLLAPARSCSSVIATMLGNHTQVYGFPELRLFVGQSIADVMRPREHVPEPWPYYARSGLIRAVAEVLFGSQSETNIDAAFNWLEERSIWAPNAVFDILRAAVAPRIALEKSPETINNDHNLKLCVRTYPDAKFIHLVRHPVSTVTSMIEHWQLRATRLTRRELTRYGIQSWFNDHRRICALKDALPSDRFIRIRAEDALADPRSTCERFAVWLGLGLDPDTIGRMLHPELSPYARMGPERALGGHDPKFLKEPRLQIGRQEEPDHFPGDWGIGLVEREALAKLAAYFGYDVRIEAGAEMTPG
jgi:hypothetical protein